MTTVNDSPLTLAWADAHLAAALVVIDPVGLGGICITSPVGPARDHYVDLMRALTPDRQWRKVPIQVTQDRLLGGLDLASTLKTGKPVIEQGLLASANGGFLVVTSAERLAASNTAAITGAMDTGESVLERDGITSRTAARFGIIALDESLGADESPPTALLDRLAFHQRIEPGRVRDIPACVFTPEDVAAAAGLLPQVQIGEPIVEALCNAAAALGIGSLRAVMFAVRTAKAVAALTGQLDVTPEEASTAARLVLGPRATIIPADKENDLPPDTETEPDVPEDNASDDSNPAPLQDRLVEAAKAAVPPDLLAQLMLSGQQRNLRSPGKSGVLQKSLRKGRPAGARRGDPARGARLNLIETLRAAAPWQSLRRHPHSTGIQVRKDDFRISRLKQRTETLIVFAVDASGSQALNRLAEVKGAVELLLADCYARRDQVAMIAFRNQSAELLLPPTRSLARAKRSLAALPGGGGTPLAAALQAAADLGMLATRKGQTPVIVFLTDGRANVPLDGSSGRQKAQDDAIAWAKRLRGEGLTALLIDTSAKPNQNAADLAAAMGARYVPLPYAGAVAISGTIRDAVRLS